MLHKEQQPSPEHQGTPRHGSRTQYAYLGQRSMQQIVPLVPSQTEPEGFEPGPETVDPFLSEEEICGDALQAVEATCVHEQTEAWCLAP